jgi:hypothetical protein
VVAAPGVYCSNTVLTVLEDRTAERLSEIPVSHDESSSMFFNNLSSAEIFHELNKGNFQPGMSEDMFPNGGPTFVDGCGYEEDDEETQSYDYLQGPLPANPVGYQAVNRNTLQIPELAADLMMNSLMQPRPMCRSGRRSSN